MFLYRFEAMIDKKVFPIVIVAENDERADKLVDIQLEKYFLREPEVDSLILYEKKRVNKGTGYVLYELETIQ